MRKIDRDVVQIIVPSEMRYMYNRKLKGNSTYTYTPSNLK
jgi:hypothetical protein